VDELSKHVDLDLIDFGGGSYAGFSPDVMIIWRLTQQDFEPMRWGSLDKANCVKVTRAPDAWEINEDYNRRCKELGIDLVVSFQSPNCQYNYLDKSIPYERYILGIDEETYPCLVNWDERRKDKILSSGVVDDRWWFYRFRGYVTNHTFVEYIPKKEYLGVNYWKLLNQYRAAIACMSFTSVLKYFEIPMCGCLMFAEVTDLNQIADMGFEDGVNCVYINDINYKKKFAEYMDTVDDPKWKKIADAGRNLVMERYTNEREVKRFVKRLQGMVDAGNRNL
jgi:hypothetical protein